MKLRWTDIVLVLALWTLYSPRPAWGKFSLFPNSFRKHHYQANFGSCPSRTAGALTMKLFKEFQSSHSLLKIKKRILEENLEKKHFLSSYNISYNPLGKMLKFSLECPLPLLRVQIYKDYLQESYNAILASNGELYDPTYEILLRSEKKLHFDLPFLALPEKIKNDEMRLQITKLFTSMNPQLRKNVAEMIVGEDEKLTIILSFNEFPSSIFLGIGPWDDKVKKLEKIMIYMESKKKIPSVINLTNSKKVVVKFSDNF